MSKLIKFTYTLIAIALFAGPAIAAGHMKGGWILSAAESKVSFGSIKKGKAGEVHHFKSVSGNVAADGMATIDIDLSSVETLADIRNERMVKFVFDAAHPKATLKAKIDMAKIGALAAGTGTTVSVNGHLMLNGKSIPVETDMYAAHMGNGNFLVTTDSMIMLSMENAGINAGISKLMELAKLPSIARVSPVTLRLLFTKAK